MHWHKHLERSKEAEQNQLEKSEAHTQPRNKKLSLALLQTYSSATHAGSLSRCLHHKEFAENMC